MKTLSFILIVIIIIFFSWQLFISSGNKKFNQIKGSYLGELQNVEFRSYKKYTKASMYINSSNMNSGNSKFSFLAKYIFGGNKENVQIGMTSPVIYSMNSKSSFSFIMPRQFEDSLPLPSNKDIFFSKVENQCVAVLSFGGFANQLKSERIKLQLQQKLKNLKINFSDEFIIAIYNPPYQFIKRKNEIWIEVNQEQLDKLLNF